MRELVLSFWKAKALGCWDFSFWPVLRSLLSWSFAPGVKLRLEGDLYCLILISAMLRIKNRVTASFPKGGCAVLFHSFQSYCLGPVTASPLCKF